MRNDILENTAYYYKRQLATFPNHELADYLKSRNLSQETQEIFGLGISPAKYDLAYILRGKGYPDTALVEYGVCRVEEPRRLVDRMNHRITLEINNFRGEHVGFAGRIIWNGDCKYVNTPNTPIFVKGNNVFNLDKAKYFIDYINNNYLILVEGYFDVMSLWDKGIRNVVAGMGTAFTDNQAKLLRLVTDNVVVCLDGDNAGINASSKVIETLHRNGINTKRLVLPDNQDPDEFVRNNKASDFLGLVNKTLEN